MLELEWKKLLLDIYSEEELKSLFQRIDEKVKNKQQLTLREDFIKDHRKYEFDPTSNETPRQIQLLYKALVRIAVETERGGTLRGKLSIDNILVNADDDRCYTLVQDIPPAQDGPFMRDSVYLLSKKIHPPGQNYPTHFSDFISLLSKVDNVDQLQKLLYHPDMQTPMQKATTVYNAFAKISHRRRVDPTIWTKFAQRWGYIDIFAPIQGDEFYRKIYNNYLADGKIYFPNARGVLYFYKDCLQHVKEEIDTKNKKIEKDIEQAREHGLNDEEIENLRNAFPIVERYSMEKIAKDMDIFFPNFVLYLYIFLIEEGLDVWTENQATNPQQTPFNLAVPPYPQPAPPIYPYPQPAPPIYPYPQPQLPYVCPNPYPQPQLPYVCPNPYPQPQLPYVCPNPYQQTQQPYVYHYPYPQPQQPAAIQTIQQQFQSQTGQQQQKQTSMQQIWQQGYTPWSPGQH